MPTTYLFVPGSRPDRFQKAWDTPAHRVILDLEDAVAPVDKAASRASVGTFLQSIPLSAQTRVMVRINDVRSPWFAEDLRWLESLPWLGVMLPKAESTADFDALRDAGSEREVIALIETVRGVCQAREVAQAGGVTRLAFGSLDYGFDLGVDGPGLALDLAGLELALASRLAELPPPIAGVTQSLEAHAVEQDVGHAKSLGFGAKLCIHPAQLAPVVQAFSPDAQTRAWAERVVSAWRDAERDAQRNAGPSGAGVGALLVDGKMVDKPVLLRAQRVLGLSNS
jgi:citrate lyase subunit beta / citryl-CoA lyase